MTGLFAFFLTGFGVSCAGCIIGIFCDMLCGMPCDMFPGMLCGMFCGMLCMGCCTPIRCPQLLPSGDVYSYTGFMKQLLCGCEQYGYPLRRLRISFICTTPLPVQIVRKKSLKSILRKYEFAEKGPSYFSMKGRLNPVLFSLCSIQPYTLQDLRIGCRCF